jgi:hypothetical protein
MITAVTGRPLKTFGAPVLRVMRAEIKRKNRTYLTTNFVMYWELIEFAKLTGGERFSISITAAGFNLVPSRHGWKLQIRQNNTCMMFSVMDDLIPEGFYVASKEGDIIKFERFVR